MILYTVLEKDTIANTIITTARFDNRVDAEDWINEMQAIFEEDRGYKIVEEELT
jgi:hypothetical protein